jgi:replication factor A2
VESLQLFGQEYKMVTIVAAVKNIEHTSTKISYELEDFSGRLFAHLWVDEDMPRNLNIMINSYVRVVGGVRSQNKVKSIMIYNIHPVSGINEVGTHYIDVVNARYSAEATAAGGDGGGSQKGGGMDVDSNVPKAGGNAQPATTDGELEGLNAKEKVIFKMIQGALETNSVEGYHKDEVYTRFPHFSRGEIDAMLDKMSTEGLIYTTVDPDHFMACF